MATGGEVNKHSRDRDKMERKRLIGERDKIKLKELKSERGFNEASGSCIWLSAVH